MVLVVVDHDRGQLDELSLQALAAARGLAAQAGEPVESVVVGGAGRDLAGVLGEHGAATLHVVTHPGLADYAPRATARSVAQLAARTGPAAVVAAGSDRGNEVMAHLGALLGEPVAADCLEVTLGEPTSVVRSRWGGSLVEHALLRGSPALVTMAAHAVAAQPVAAGPASVREVTPELDDADLAVQVVDRVEDTAGGVTLADAKVIVSGGRGVGSSDGFAPLEELAALLGGTVGCSRVATSEGWRPHTDQVGQTGTKVAPDLYIACGISGATQHLAGCRSSKTILVVNKDPEAPILAHADYAVIGDLHAVLPAIVEETRKAVAQRG